GEFAAVAAVPRALGLGGAAKVYSSELGPPGKRKKLIPASRTICAVRGVVRFVSHQARLTPSTCGLTWRTTRLVSTVTTAKSRRDSSGSDLAPGELRKSRPPALDGF